jgi:hypothetical protein
MIDYFQVLAQAQVLSPDKNYDLTKNAFAPVVQALVEQVNANTGATNYVIPLMVTADAAFGTPVVLRTVTSSNTQAAVFLLAVYVECNTAGTGTLRFRVNWTYNGGAGSEETTISLGALDANINTTFLIYADVGTDITYDYEVTGYTSGTAVARMVASLTQLI